MDNAKAVEIFNKWMDCKDAYQADPSCDGNCFSCEYYASAEEEKEAMQMAIAALEQQEKAFDEWCPDCKEYDKEQHFCHRFTKVIRQAVEEHRKEWPDGKWIPVTERLPENFEGVLAWIERNKWGDGDTPTKTQECAIGWQIDGSWHFDGYSGKGTRCIAWRPLPEPYQEGEA